MKAITLIFIYASAILANAKYRQSASTKNNVASFIGTLNDLTNRFNATLNSTTQEDDTVKNILTALEDVQSSAANLQSVADALDELQNSNDLKHDADNTKDSWDDWKKKTLWKAARKYGRNSDEYNRYDFDVKELPDYYEPRLDSCTKSIIKDLTNQQTNIDNSVSKALVTIRNLLDVQQNCLASPSTQCSTNIQRQLVKVQNIPTELNTLTDKGYEFNNTSYENRTCVKGILDNFDKEKNSISRHL